MSCYGRLTFFFKDFYKPKIMNVLSKTFSLQPHKLSTGGFAPHQLVQNLTRNTVFFIYITDITLHYHNISIYNITGYLTRQLLALQRGLKE